jgi:predicted ATPase
LSVAPILFFLKFYHLFQSLMPQDSIRELHVEGLRTLIDVHLQLHPLTVLTGENGSGKSTIIEACEILRLASDPKFLEEFLKIHGGFEAFRSYGAKRVRLGVRIEGQGDPLEYWFQIEDIAGLAITAERLTIFPTSSAPYEVLTRTGRTGTTFDPKSGKTEPLAAIPGAKLLLTSLGYRVPHPAISRTIRALQQIEVHLPFAVLPSWVERRVAGTGASMRSSPLSAPKDTLERLGLNLANVYQALRSESVSSWSTTLDYVRLGLGDDIEDVLVEKTRDGSALEILFRYRAFPSKVPASSLSDGTLGYLAFVALFRLAPKKSLLAFDEPEGSLHPMMTTRVAQLLEALSNETSIIVATHSDRFLDALTDPEQSVVLCALGPGRETKIVRPNKAALNKWLQSYSGFGEIRSAGHESSVMLRSPNGKPHG